MNPQKYEFQTEVARLLHLVTHSLYSNREIFLRELISNASDACERLRFEALEKPELYDGQTELRIRISLDKDKKTMSIADTGIGMSAADAIENLGTIAHSGTRAFMQQLESGKTADAQMIGQFGVGFYSGFIVAEKIEVFSRRAGLSAEEGVHWTSDGSGEFEVEPATLPERGTTVTLHVRDDALEFADGWRLRELIARYSDHIALPIEMEEEKWEEGEEGKPGKMLKTGKWEAVNQATALWTRAKKDITEEQASQFYQQLARDWQPPLTWSLHRVEGSTEYTQLLYIPSHAPLDLWERERKEGLKLYVQRVFIMDDAEQLLPRYLRFVKGVVDSADLPLNVSREILQESRDVRAIREGNTRRVLAMLEDMAKEKPAENTEKEEKAEEKAPDYRTFWREFGAVIKEGIGEDGSNRERIARLLRYTSTAGDFVSLSSYKARMKDGQKAIYYICADSQEAA
ncbi:MAG: molecular chaperone HtpG, partial [Rhodocyclaceae bacterium]|nr:molecular chaperone HtpG [Rhodocyclaceae bacterium]